MALTRGTLAVRLIALALAAAGVIGWHTWQAGDSVEPAAFVSLTVILGAILVLVSHRRAGPARSQGGAREEVGGWLAALGIVLVVLGPSTALRNLQQTVTELAPHFDSVPNLQRLTALETALSVGLAAFSAYAGLSLMWARAGAVRTAKRYLVTAAAWQALSLALPFLVGVPAEVSHAMLADGAWVAGATAVVAGLSHVSLSRSKRVS